MPFSLHRVHRANDLLEGVQSPAPLHQRQGPFPVLRGLEHEICECPPMKIVQVEVAIHARAPVAGNDTTQGDHTAVAKILREIRAGGDLIHPPNGVGVRINASHRERSRRQAAGGEILGQSFLQPFLKAQMGHLLVELVGCFVQHPVAWVDFVGRVIREAVRLTVKCLRPAQARIHPA